MKKLYSIVLMATALLIGTNAKAVNVTDFAGLQSAITAAEAGTPTTIVLEADISDAGRINVQQGKQIVLDLNGHNIESTADYMIIVINASLELKNTQDAGGVFSGSGWAAYIMGSNDDVANYSVLNIGVGVTLTTTNNYGVVLYNASAAPQNGYGIVFDLYGEVRVENGNALWVMGNIKAKTGNIPQVNIHDGATIVSASTKVCLYGGGYAQFNIEGTVEGGTGIYAKSGDYNISGNAVVRSTATTHEEVVANGNGYTGGIGCAIVSDSKNGYAGGMEIEISGNATIESHAEGGYAIEEVKSDAATSKTESLVIESGTINGNLSTTAELQENVVVNGTITGGTFDTDVTAYLSTVTGVITPVTDESGNTVYVINEKPNADPWITDIASATAASYVRLTGSYSATLAADAQAKYLVMQDNAKIIVPAGKKMTVGEVVMGQNTVIEVQAGGKLIITDAQGLVANYASNIVLHASETEQAIFLFNPAVTSNRNPKATVEFISRSFVDGSNYAAQRFGIPTHNALTSIDAVDPADPTVKVRARFYNFDYANNTWNSLGYINGTGSDPELDLANLANPFEFYQMYNYRTTAGTKVIMKGALVGNENPQLNIRGNFWNGFSNSFMAPIDGATLISEIPNTVDKAFYLYDITSEQQTWESYTLINIEEQGGIRPMQPFLIRNTLAAADVEVNYEAAVYNPAMGIVPNPVSARRVADMTKAKLIVKGEGCIDRVTVAEDAEFSAEFDNGYDAVKYMNEGINMYVSADEKMSIFATDNLNNTFVGIQVVNGGNYTIEFAKVQGEELFLIDHETGAQVAIVEGATYEFTANGTNDYRFELVGAAKLPTAIENAEAVKSAKGIYTITGQYVGEMNVWNTLPAGIYVVNGEKLVK